ncbi:hypothetical protein JHK85_009897 [Glycine max]|nr:hypothetical protein JHK85_009897 [Glycine max]
MEIGRPFGRAQDDQGNQYNPLLQNPSFQQQNSTLNGPTPLPSGFATSSILNSAILGLSGTSFYGGSSSQVFNNQPPQFASLLRDSKNHHVAVAPGNTLNQVRHLFLLINTESNQVNAMYDPAFERAGVPIDPFLRLFKANSGNNNRAISIVPTHVERLMLEGVVSSFQGQDLNQTGYLNQFPNMENEDILARKKARALGRLVIGVVECGQGISHGDGCGSNGKSPLHVQQLEEALEIWDTKVGGKDGWAWNLQSTCCLNVAFLMKFGKDAMYG